MIKYVYSKTIAVRAVEALVKAAANLKDGFTEYPEERHEIDVHIEAICDTIPTKLYASFLYVNSIYPMVQVFTTDCLRDSKIAPLYPKIGRGTTKHFSFFLIDFSPNSWYTVLLRKGGGESVSTEKAWSNKLTTAVSRHGKQPLLLSLR